MRRLKQNMMRIIWVIACAASLAQAAPFAEKILFSQPDGTQIELWGEGDEFHAVFETLDGYTVVFDPVTKAYQYAVVSADGQQLEPTGLQVGKADPGLLGLARHARVAAEAARKQGLRRFARWDLGMEVTQRWAARKSERRLAAAQAADGPIVMAPPAFTTTGQKMGLCLLIDFDDDPATVPHAEIVDYCNGDAYTGSGNNGSVKKYFLDNSNNLLVYSNTVTAYIRIPNSLHPKSYYNDTTQDAGVQANLMIRDALDIMKALPNYETEILPSFSQLTVDAEGRAVACNVFYAGGNGGVWSQGLWPHSWALYEVGAQELSPGGTRIFRYQVTNIGSSLKIGTFCHENGHMLCGYPDLYDYGYDSIGGAGDFCLMGYGGGGGNPAQICAYLKDASGWATTVEVTLESGANAVAVATQGADGFNRFYRYAKPGVDTEYFLFENRQRTGRDASLPAGGIAVWHIDELGDKDIQSLAYNTTHQNYECTLVQADNLWHFQKNVNSGDANDLYFLGNTSAGYQNVLADSTEPSARWWDGSESMMEAHSFSASGPEMTFIIAPRPPVILSPGGLPDGRVGTVYSYALLASGGMMPYVWQMVDGSLPLGLTLGGDGLISGMPEAEGTESFSIAVTGSNGVAATNQFSLVILPAFTAPYKETFENGGGAPDGWMQEFVTGEQPWQFRTGGLWGHPFMAYAGTYNAYLGVGSLMERVTRLVSPRIDFGESPRAARLSFWHYMENWAGGQDELRVYYKTSWAEAWIPLESYVTTVGTWTQRTLTLPNPGRTYYVAFEGKAKYGYGICVDNVEIWDPTPPLAITSESPLPSATTEIPYTLALAAEGGVEPFSYTYQIISGGLPAGFDMTADGVISGLSSNVQSSSFVVQVTDNTGGGTATKSFTLAVTLPRADLYAEDFEAGGVISGGWTQEFVTNTVAWTFRNGGIYGHPTAAASGNYNAYLFSSAWVNGNSYDQKTKLVSPLIDLGQAPADIRLTFWHHMENWADGQDQLRVFYKAATNDAWALLATYTSNVPSWTRQSVTLPNPTSTYRIAFEGNARFGYGVCVDDVRISDDAASPVITTGQALPNAVTAFSYSTTLSAVGGMPPYTWAVVSNALPAGLTLDPGGVISGTAGSQAWAYFRVSVAGADGKASTNLFSLRVVNPGPMPFTETFEGGELPFGWTQENDTGSANWTFRSGSPVTENRTPAAAYAGQYNACLFAPKTAFQITKLITPMLNLGVGSTNTRLTFWHCMAPYYGLQDELRVYYRSSASEPWQQLANFQAGVTAWTQRTIDLPNPSTTYYIAFEGWARYGYGICIDDVTVTGDMLLTPYEAWQADHFGEDVGNELIAGDEADPDGDGIANALEYAMGFDPLTPTTEGLPFGGVTAGYLTLSFRMDKEALDSGVLFGVEACTDLILRDWTDLDVSEQLPRADSNAWWQAVFQHDVPVTNAPQRFLRLKVTLP